MTMGNKNENELFLFDSSCFDINKIHWSDEFPRFENEDLRPSKTAIINFATDKDFYDFMSNNNLKKSGASYWWPAQSKSSVSSLYWGGGVKKNKYPIYIISKGRFEKTLTADALDWAGVDYRIVVEPQEFKDYAKKISPEKIIQLPFSNLGLGSIPARNFVFENSVNEGHKKHWILDDNIKGFYFFNGNLKIKVKDATPFVSVENISDKFLNAYVCGMQYDFFILRKNGSIPPYSLNKRVYSCILIDNSMPFKWRGRYNEDTDLCLRVLKSGNCTILVNAFCCGKQETMSMSGGNTDQLYKIKDGRRLMTDHLISQHPDCAQSHQRWGRVTHKVDYSAWADNDLIKNDCYAPQLISPLKLFREAE